MYEEGCNFNLTISISDCWISIWWPLCNVGEFFGNFNFSRLTQLGAECDLCKEKLYGDDKKMVEHYATIRSSSDLHQIIIRSSSDHLQMNFRSSSDHHLIIIWSSFDQYQIIIWSSFDQYQIIIRSSSDLLQIIIRWSTTPPTTTSLRRPSWTPSLCQYRQKSLEPFWNSFSQTFWYLCNSSKTMRPSLKDCQFSKWR